MATSYRQLLAQNIRAERARAGLSQADLAERMRFLGHGWLHQTVANVERGKRRVLAEEVLALALAFNVSILRLMEPARSGETVGLPSGIEVPVSGASGPTWHLTSLETWHGNILDLSEVYRFQGIQAAAGGDPIAPPEEGRE